ncbi:MAG: hypothetical protein IT373_36055 [Polyangiaceae bacterium]|nr:hypothetical protein [Polyangiaceae bacterium]
MSRSLVTFVLLACACRTGGPAAGLAVGPAVGPTASASSSPSSAGSAREAPLAAAVPPSPGDACAADDDCVATNFPGCCACPQCASGEPHARSREAARRAEAACALASCDLTICAVAGMCPPGEPAAHFAARCQAGACVLERRTPPDR